MNQEIIKFCLGKGILLEREILNALNESNDIENLKIFLEKIKLLTKQKVINKSLFENNKTFLKDYSQTLSEDSKKNFENLINNLGIFFQNESKNNFKKVLDCIEKKENMNIKVTNMIQTLPKSIEVKDFVNFFKSRLNEMKNFLQDNSELNNLVSINKISGKKQNISIIGMVYSKKVTKNKNMLIEIEDSTGRITILINKDKEDLYKKAEDIALDSIIGLKGSGSKELFFVSEIIFPEANLNERKRADLEEYALFLGDLHFGSKLFLKKDFLKFIDYINGKVENTPEVKKIKYLFLVGDLVTGVGNYPNQENDLEIQDLEQQFIHLAKVLNTIRKDIKIIISPGNHDGVRLMEPQPMLDEKYAWPIYEIENVIITTNPSTVNIGSKEGFQGFDVLTYHGFSFTYYANNVPKLMIKKAMNTPEEIIKYLLKQRHLAPTHASNQYFPTEKDSLVLSKIPDIILAGHTHKSAVSYYNNILIISTSCWESMTPYQEKFGNKPDHCKVPMFNLKTRAIKILDFKSIEKNDN